MKFDFILQLVAYTIPALVTAAISYIYFTELLNRQSKKDAFLLQQKKQDELLALKLQAYERFAILLERIDLKKLVLRVIPVSTDKNAYQVLLIQHIEQEFEYNLSQQIYISNELWTIISSVKNAIISEIQKTALTNTCLDADTLRKELLSNGQSSQKATATFALLALKEEVNFYTK